MPSIEAFMSVFDNLGLRLHQILEQKANDYSNTFPNKVLSVRLPTNAVRRFLVKYESDCFRNVGGHRGGPSYEADVYRQILTPLQLPRPEFVGATHGTEDGNIWLFVEFVEGSTRPDEVQEPIQALRRA